MTFGKYIAMTTPPNKIWFPSKSYGYGWGPPTCWQGWVVLLIYFTLLAGGAFLMFSEKKDAPIFILYAIGLSLILVFVCRLKGEKPAWRWGKPKEQNAEKKNGA